VVAFPTPSEGCIADDAGVRMSSRPEGLPPRRRSEMSDEMRRSEEEDAEGQAVKKRLDEDDTEGQRVRKRLDEDDTEGQGRHGKRLDEDDTEGHFVRKRLAADAVEEA
jgi:hypothetical protein